jgi:hypothetical protein
MTKRWSQLHFTRRRDNALVPCLAFDNTMIHCILIWFLALFAAVPFSAHGKPDENRRSIRMAALRYLMLQHATAPGREREVYAFYVLEDKECVSNFSGFNPPVFAYDTNRFETGPGAVEKKTGKRVKIWSVGEPKIKGDQASVSVSWYSSNRAAGWHTIFLKRENGVDRDV